MRIKARFNYKDFKATMEQRGHQVNISDNTITVAPDNYVNKNKIGFADPLEVIQGFGRNLKFLTWCNSNQCVFWAKYEIVNNGECA